MRRNVLHNMQLYSNDFNLFLLVCILPPWVFKAFANAFFRKGVRAQFFITSYTFSRQRTAGFMDRCWKHVDVYYGNVIYAFTTNREGRQVLFAFWNNIRLNSNADLFSFLEIVNDKFMFLQENQRFFYFSRHCKSSVSFLLS